MKVKMKVKVKVLYFAVVILLCASGVAVAQSGKKKSVFDKIFKPTPTATPPVDTTSAASSGDKIPANNTSGKLSFKDDEFTGKRTVVLEKLVLATDLNVTLSTDIDLKTLNETRPNGRDATSRWLADAAIVFIIPKQGRALFLSEGKRFDFMVDGARVEGNGARSSFYGSRTPGIEEVISVMNLDRLGKVVRGRDVKMKLGDKIYTIDQSAKDRLKEFLKALGR